VAAVLHFKELDRAATVECVSGEDGRFPSRQFAINQAWLELALTGIDLLAWTQTLLLDGALATAEPTTLAAPRTGAALPHETPRLAAAAAVGGVLA
jgi:hypothetical protein